jgi:hypothetical protein
MLYLVPVLKKPIKRPRKCPVCHTPHPCKTVHLHLVEGDAIVSSGVLAELKMAGMPDLDVVEVVARPPALEIGRVSRQEQDQRNRKVVKYGVG